MAIKLYDAVPSSNSDRVKIALHEKGLDYQRVTLSLVKKDQKRPEFLKLNPYGKVPVIVDDGRFCSSLASSTNILMKNTRPPR